jgi:hypothetical protein
VQRGPFSESEQYARAEHQSRHFKGEEMNVLRIAAFSDGDAGGNPAGVLIGDELPTDSEMKRIAADVGFSETAFAVSTGTGWRVRYFSPESGGMSDSECDQPFVLSRVAAVADD